MAPSPFPKNDHDHEGCKLAILATAEKRCQENGVRFTKLRRQVLEILAENHQAMGAYDILARLQPETKGRAMAPVTIYRALDFLMENHLVHRLNSLNAFIACSTPHHGLDPQFLVCQHCRSVAEFSPSSVHDAIHKETASINFAITTPMVEIRGICASCQTEDVQP